MTFSVLIRRIANTDAPNSWANRLRTQRFRKFEALVADMPRPLRILDVGGTNQYWERRGCKGAKGNVSRGHPHSRDILRSCEVFDGCGGSPNLQESQG